MNHEGLALVLNTLDARDVLPPDHVGWHPDDIQRAMRDIRARAGAEYARVLEQGGLEGHESHFEAMRAVNILLNAARLVALSVERFVPAPQPSQPQRRRKARHGHRAEREEVVDDVSWLVTELTSDEEEQPVRVQPVRESKKPPIVEEENELRTHRGRRPKERVPKAPKEPRVPKAPKEPRAPKAPKEPKQLRDSKRHRIRRIRDELVDVPWLNRWKNAIIDERTFRRDMIPERLVGALDLHVRRLERPNNNSGYFHVSLASGPRQNGSPYAMNGGTEHRGFIVCFAPQNDQVVRVLDAYVAAFIVAAIFIDDRIMYTGAEWFYDMTTRTQSLDDWLSTPRVEANLRQQCVPTKIERGRPGGGAGLNQPLPVPRLSASAASATAAYSSRPFDSGVFPEVQQHIEAFGLPHDADDVLAEIVESGEYEAFAELAESVEPVAAGANAEGNETVTLLITIAESCGKRLEHADAVSFLVLHDWNVEEAAAFVCSEVEE